MGEVGFLHQMQNVSLRETWYGDAKKIASLQRFL